VAIAAQPLVVDLREDAPVLDAAALRDAIARELGIPAVAPEGVAERAPELTVRVNRDRGELTVEYRGRDPGADAIVRHVALPLDPNEALRRAVFLAGNLARDEAGDVLRSLRSEAPAPPESSDVSLARSSSAPRAASDPTADEPSDSESRQDETLASDDKPPFRARLWIGVSVEQDWTSLPNSNDPCGGPYECVRADPAAFPMELVGQAVGEVVGGVTRANARFLVSMDGAVTPNLLLGGRFGLVFATKTFESLVSHLHIAARATYAFGDRPLERAGLAPITEIGVGAAEHSASVEVQLYDTGPPLHPYDRVYSWRRGGPGFVSAGAGLRWALGPGFALTALPLRATVAFGNSTPLYLFSPEIAVQFRL
jgi:hypothetical protein